MKLTPEQKDYKAQLAESQAREVKLREVLKFYANPDEWSGFPWKLLFNSSDVDGDGFATAKNALSDQSDASALNELIAKAGEVMRERCATLVPYHYEVTIGKICALPDVTLEDLNHD